MMFPLIPRVRVNYSLIDILRSLFCNEKSFSRRNQLRIELCRLFGVDDILLTSSGRASIFQVLKSLPQGRVIVPAYTCKVVVEAALLAGKKVEYASTSKSDFNISSLPDDIDENTVVVATHQYGIPCDIKEIARLCKCKGAVLLEDCAASLGSTVDGQLTGAFGEYAIFSFDSSKMITVPSKGGFIIAKDKENLERIKLSTSLYPSSILYKLKHLTRGCIYIVLKNKCLYRIFHYLTMQRKGQMQLDDHARLDLSMGEFYTHSFYEWQAVIALTQVKELSRIIAKRREIYSFYDKHINNPIVQKPIYDKESACIRYAILVKNKADFYNKCLELGVDMGFSFNHIAAPDSFREEHGIAEDVLNLPYYYDMSKEEVNKVVEVINSIR